MGTFDMRGHRGMGLAVALALAGCGSAARAEAVLPGGIWMDDEGRAGIEITRCERALCGRIVWLKEPNDSAGQPLKDIMNPDTAKREAPVCGLQIIGDLKRKADDEWVEGWIYDPEQGKRFSLEIHVKDKSGFTIVAWDGERVKSETHDWKRLPDTQPRCK